MIALPQTVLSSNLYGDSVFVVRREGEGDAAVAEGRAGVREGGPPARGPRRDRRRREAGRPVVPAGQNRLSGGATVTIDNSLNPLPRPRRAGRAPAMHFTEIFIRRPVLSTVLAAFILLLGFQGIFNLAVRQYPEVEETVVTITTTYPGAPPDLIQGFITAPIAAGGRHHREHRLPDLAEPALGQRRQRQHAARRRPRRRADRGALQGAAGARRAARGGRGPGDRQGHRLRFRADVSRGDQPEHDARSSSPSTSIG